MDTAQTRSEIRHEIMDACEETHTKRGRARLVRLARAGLGFPFTIVGTTDSGEPARESWLIQTPTDARVFVDTASSRIDWAAR